MERLRPAALVLAGDFLKKSRLLCFIGRHSLPLFASQTFAIYLVIEGIAEVTGITYIPMFEMPGRRPAFSSPWRLFCLCLRAFGYTWNVKNGFSIGFWKISVNFVRVQSFT